MPEPKSSAFDCLCAGIIVADHVCEPVDHLPAPGELILTRRMELLIGGCASNVAVDLVRLGLNAALVGKVGDDVFGRHINEALTAAGVDCRHLGVADQCDTAGTLIINCRGQDRRFIHSIGANGRFTGSEVTDEMIAAARVLYLGGYLLCDSMAADEVARSFRTARKTGVPTLLDVVIPGPGNYQDRLKAVLPWTDYFFPNDDEARTITGLSDPRDQAEAFLAAGARTVVITCGNRGALVASRDGLWQAGTHAVEFVDGTGSGDAFAAGWIYGLRQGADALGCLRYGSASGAQCVTAMGATTGVFSAGELEEFVAAHPLAIERVR